MKRHAKDKYKATRNRNLSGNVCLPLRLDIRRRPLWVTSRHRDVMARASFWWALPAGKSQSALNRRPSNTGRTDCTHDASRSLRTSSRRAFFQSDHL